METGSQTDSLAGQISDPAQVLTPVLETNYQILYDEEEVGKTILVIKPADRIQNTRFWTAAAMWWIFRPPATEDLRSRPEARHPYLCGT